MPATPATSKPQGCTGNYSPLWSRSRVDSAPWELGAAAVGQKSTTVQEKRYLRLKAAIDEAPSILPGCCAIGALCLAHPYQLAHLVAMDMPMGSREKRLKQVRQQITML